MIHRNNTKRLEMDYQSIITQLEELRSVVAQQNEKIHVLQTGTQNCSEIPIDQTEILIKRTKSMSKLYKGGTKGRNIIRCPTQKIICIAKDYVTGKSKIEPPNLHS